MMNTPLDSTGALAAHLARRRGDSDPVHLIYELFLGRAGTSPEAARSTLRALIEEGRRFAASPDGQHWCAMLERLPVLAQGRALWQVFNLDAYLQGSEDPPPTPPDQWLAGLAQLAGTDAAGALSWITSMAATVDPYTMRDPW